ncbi:hypothetical protein C8R44DRAFT_986665 [Mycena epipterygia]|nr:hypothetical protein C8R44DRAFT_986665 [Mycena epipterygia]
MAVVTTLFAGIQAQLLSGIPSGPSPDASQGVIHVLLLVNYGGLAANVGATLSGMIVLDLAGDVPETFRRLRTAGRHSPSSVPAMSSTETGPDTGLGLLLSHGARHDPQFAWYHCAASTIFGTLSILLQISLLAWINILSQASGVFTVVVLALFWAALPLPGLLLYNYFSEFVASLKRGLE